MEAGYTRAAIPASPKSSSIAGRRSLEILLTVDEETGLTGAKEVPVGFFTGSVLLNLDSEEEGAFYVGCAGGTGVVGSAPRRWIVWRYADEPRRLKHDAVLARRGRLGTLSQEVPRRAEGIGDNLTWLLQ